MRLHKAMFVSLVLAGAMGTLLIFAGRGHDVAERPFNGQILHTPADLAAAAAVVTVAAQGLPAKSAYRVAFSEWQTNRLVLDVVILGQRSAQVALPQGRYSYSIAVFDVDAGIRGATAPHFVSAAPFFAGDHAGHASDLRLDVAQALGLAHGTDLRALRPPRTRDVQ